MNMLLGKALLWKIFNDEEGFVPLEISERVKAAYKDIGTRCQLQEHENPVQKVPLAVYQGESDAHVIIEELFTTTEDGTEDGAQGERRAGQAASQGLRDEIRFLNSQVMSMRREQTDHKVEMMRTKAQHNKSFQVLNRNVISMQNQISDLPTAIGGGEQNGNVNGRDQNEDNQIAAGVDPNAKLSSCPKNALVLWNEYQHGIGDNKPAKMFTIRERGQNRHRYSKRKVLWDKVARLVDGGWTARAACDKIHSIYGTNRPMTEILLSMRRDQRERGGHPELKITNL